MFGGGMMKCHIISEYAVETHQRMNSLIHVSFILIYVEKSLDELG